MHIQTRVRELMEEAGVNAMDLVRFGMAQGTAYNLSRNRIRRIDLDTLGLLCDFLSQKLNRQVCPGDILTCPGEDGVKKT